MFPIYTPWKYQKTKSFLVFSGGINWEHWPEMDWLSAYLFYEFKGTVVQII